MKKTIAIAAIILLSCGKKSNHHAIIVPDLNKQIIQGAILLFILYFTMRMEKLWAYTINESNSIPNLKH
jgi:hypothetical protein